MTVCVAAIYNNNSILGVSDRMVTGGYGDIEFEPQVPKIFSVTNSIALMTAGDQNIQMQVMQRAAPVVSAKIKEAIDNKKWVAVLDIVDIYSKCFYELRNKLAENKVLVPFNLTMESFISRQREMHPDFISDITNRIDRFPRDYMDGIETILTGIDENGPHIYVLRNGVIDCNDKLGFAAIGIGAGHATSHFMFSGYSRIASESKALLTIHQAKKKSEVSPGVGEKTDMCHIGPLPGTFNMITEYNHGGKIIPIVNDLDKLYGEYRRKIKKIDENTEKKIKDYLKKLPQPANPEQQINPVPPALPEDKIKEGEK